MKVKWVQLQLLLKKIKWYGGCTIYSINDYKNILSEAEKILSDVPEVTDNKDNEFEVFMQILIKFVKSVYGDKEFNDNSNVRNNDDNRFKTIYITWGAIR